MKSHGHVTVDEQNINQTIELLKRAQARADGQELAKATFNQPTTSTSGLQSYNLEQAAKNLYPVLAPLRNMLPRVGGQFATQANWKAVTAINTGNVFPGVAEGRRAGVIAVSTAEYFAAFRTLGEESNVTWEAELAAAQFDDIKARSAKSALEALMMAEEQVILGGSTSYSINGGAACPTPTLVNSTSGGTLAAQTWSVVCIPLAFDGRIRSTLAGGVVQTFTQSPAEGGSTITVNGGAGRASAAATATTTGTTSSLVASVSTSGVPGVRGAYAYAWFWGTGGSERLGAITKVSTVSITAAAPGGNQALSALNTSTDYSKNDLIHDGLLTMAANPANGAYWNALTGGAGLTPDSSGGIVEIDTALKYFWDTLRLTPTRILIGSQEVGTLKKKILSQPAASAARFTFTVQQGALIGGGMARGYLNPYGAANGPAEIPFMQHPFLPDGTIMFMTEKLPYALSNVTDVMRILTRKDYHQLEWPMRTRLYEYGVYTDQVLQHYFIPSLGVITNISDA
jgi:hypothetical protein